MDRYPRAVVRVVDDRLAITGRYIADPAKRPRSRQSPAGSDIPTMSYKPSPYERGQGVGNPGRLSCLLYRPSETMGAVIMSTGGLQWRNIVDISVRDLKNHLSEYLRRVQAGEDIIVTSHGKRVARLSAVAEPPLKDDPEGVAIARLRAQPWT